MKFLNLIFFLAFWHQLVQWMATTPEEEKSLELEEWKSERRQISEKIVFFYKIYMKPEEAILSAYATRYLKDFLLCKIL